MVRYLEESTEKEIFLESDAPRRLFFYGEDSIRLPKKDASHICTL